MTAYRLPCLAWALAAWLLALPAWSQAPSATPAESESVIDRQARLLAQAGTAVVGLTAVAVSDARSIETLGHERQGSGVVIDDDGLVLTIGYLVLEADEIDLVTADDRIVPARPLAYDQATGFGLVQALTPLKVTPARLGQSARLTTGEPLMIVSGGEDADWSLARMVSRRAFSAFWEYHIEGALFTVPARPDHSGAALFNGDGELLGIGSLLVTDALGPGKSRQAGNMFVPIDLLKPVLAEMRELGSSRQSHRAWLGVNCTEQGGQVRVLRVTRDSPAEAAGLQAGDHIVRIDGTAVNGLKPFYLALWRGDSAERDVVLEVRRGSEARSVRLRAIDRMSTLRKPQGI